MNGALVQHVRRAGQIMLPLVVLGVCVVLVVTFVRNELPAQVSVGTERQAAQVIAGEGGALVSLATAWQHISSQVAGVWSRTAQTAQLIFSIDSLPTVRSAPLTQFAAMFPEDNVLTARPLGTEAEALQINIPLLLTDGLVVTGGTQLGVTTIDGVLTATAETNLSSLFVNGVTNLRELTVTDSASMNALSAQTFEAASIRSEQASIGSLLVTGETDLESLVRATGGVQTDGADIDAGTGNIFAANVVNDVIAGNNIIISGTRNAPVVSLDTDDLEVVQSLNGEQGELELLEGTGIRISGMRIESEDTLLLVRNRGGCVNCITDDNVVPNLTLVGSLIDNTVIGSTTRAAGYFTSVSIGTSTASTTLTVGGGVDISDVLTVTGTATSTFGGTVNLLSGCFAVNGTCIDGSDISYTGLLDTPSTLLAASVPFVNEAGDALTQSADLLFDGTLLSVGSATTSVTLAVGGAATVGDVLTVAGTATSTFGGSVDLTSGCFALNGECVALGLDSYVDLSDTPSVLIAGALQYASSSATALTQSSNLVFDGTRLGVGTDELFTELTVAGNASILGGGALRFYDDDNSAYVGLQASSSLASSLVWTLPIADGASNQLLVTDGNRQLRFADISSIGGGANSYLELNDTPDAFIDYSIPFVNATGSALTQASNLVYRDGFFGVGLNNPSKRLTVLGDVQFESSVGNVGMLFDTSLNRFGFGTESPTDFMTVQGGSITQRGGVAGDLYSPRTVANMPLIAQINDVVVVGEYAYIVSNQDGHDFHVVDVSNPNAPVEVESIPLDAGATALAISGQYAYVTSEVGGDDFHVIDISDPLDVVEVASVPLPSTANAVALRGQYAFVGTDNPGTDFHVIDISNPLAPFEVTSAALNMDDTINDIVVAGKYAYAVSSVLDFDFHVIDISDPRNPVEVGQINLPAAATAVAVAGRYAYVTTTTDGNDFHVIDVSNPLLPVEIGWLQLDAGATDVFVAGRYAYVTSLATGADVHVIDVVNPSGPVLVGALDLSAGAVQTVTVVGRYAYLGSSITGDEFHVVDISGAELQSADIYTLAAGELNVSGNTQVAGLITAGRGVRVGIEGIQTDGQLSVLSTSTTYIAGNVGIGTTTPSSKLTVDGTIQATNLAGESTALETDANGNIIRVVSDARLKTNIVTIEGALADVLQLRGVRYEWIDTERFGTQVEVGFLAQEVDAVVPEVVRKGGEYWSLNTRNLVAVVVEAIKELWHMVLGNQAEIADLRERVENLEQQLETFTNEVEIGKDATSPDSVLATEIDPPIAATKPPPSGGTLSTSSSVVIDDTELPNSATTTEQASTTPATQADSGTALLISSTSTSSAINATDLEIGSASTSTVHANEDNKIIHENTDTATSTTEIGES